MSKPTPKPMLEFRSVSHAYTGAGLPVPTPSVADISFSVSKGEVVSLLGPSGSGKSTILRLAAGLEQPHTGEVWLAGVEIATPHHMTMPEERGIGLVFQDYALFPHMTIMDNVLFALGGRHYRHISNAEKICRAELALEKVDLMDASSRHPDELSGGQQQRVALARALVPNPKLILLDEPFAGLDIRLKERIRDDMLHVLHDIGMTVLMVTHDSDEAMFMSNRIMVMNGGRIVQTGSPIDVFRHPNSAFVAEFFGEVNTIESVVKGGAVKTPFGDYAANGLADGTAASMIIRNDGLLVDVKKNGGYPAEVIETIMLGRYSIVHMTMQQKMGKPLHLHARVPPIQWFEEGTQVSLKVDQDQVFIFKKSD
ncbi:MAG: ABC transporter ATP-binding protein [Proteobacteria bacterium]|nr:ABC transporter ATP-binding protein [Pseudomonadota bacterium]